MESLMMTQARAEADCLDMNEELWNRGQDEQSSQRILCCQEARMAKTKACAAPRAVSVDPSLNLIRICSHNIVRSL